jgi:two-component system response regulator RegX3
MKADVLIIEDERELAELVSLYLEREGISVTCTESAEAGLSLFSSNQFDLILLDINLPGMDGFEFLQQIRRNSSIPVIIVSARESDEDVIMGLGSGADEFVTKPFTPKVLAARVRALLRRSTIYQEQERTVYRFGDFELDYHGYNLKRGGSIVPISAREFEVLRFLVEHAGTAYSLSEIFDQVWGQEFGEVTAVSVYVQRIRKKIERDYHQPEYIKTIHGKGYIFVKERLL